MSSRLNLALESGALDLPDLGSNKGIFGFFNADADLDLCGIAPDQAFAVQSVFPVHARLEARGIPVAPDAPDAMAAALVHCHRARPASFAYLHDALTHVPPGGLICVDGAKTEGIESVLKELRRRFEGVEAYSKAHGKLVWLTRPEVLPDISDWARAPRKIEGGFVTYPGVFSADGPDKGSQMLVEHLPELKGAGVDLGAGWGYLAAHVLKAEAVTKLDMIEADHLACVAARENITDPRAQISWGDALAHKGAYDFVVTNPPFHASRKADPAIGQAFIAQAASLLRAKGQLWMVANINLPYEQTLLDHFRHMQIVARGGGFKIITARGPKSARTGR